MSCGPGTGADGDQAFVPSHPGTVSAAEDYPKHVLNLHHSVNFLYHLYAMDRRKFIRSAGMALPAVGVLPVGVLGVLNPVDGNMEKGNRGREWGPEEPADYTIRIGTGLVEVGPQHIISTTTYNGQFPGPLLRFKEGQRAVVDIYNDTDRPEQFHWHGQFVPVEVDGAAEEGTPYIPAHGMRREVFVPVLRDCGFIIHIRWQGPI